MGNKIPAISAVLLILMIGQWAAPRILPAGPKDASGQSTPSPAQYLKIRVWTEPGPKAVTTQQVRFIIEISTPTWFDGGTRIHHLELNDAVVRQAGQFASNFTQNERGITRSVQQWTFFIYPLKEKTYRIPEVPIFASIADPEGGSPLSGEIRTPPVRFFAVTPDDLKGINHWVAASRLTVREEYRVRSNTYEEGDAIKREIHFEADGLPAMMLPVFAENSVPGFAVYEAPPEINDDVNRGQIIGRRVERITYFVEKPGTYRIPARTYTWYNIDSGQTEKITLPEKLISTPGFNGSPNAGKDLPSRLFPAIVAGLLFIFLFLVIRYGKRKKQPDLKPSSTALKRALRKAVNNGKREDVIRILYQWFDRYGGIDGNNTHWRQFLSSYGTPCDLDVFNDCMTIFRNPDTPAKPAAMPPAKKLADLIGRRKLNRPRLKKTDWPFFILTSGF